MGGYQIIDLGGVDIMNLNNAALPKGTYDKIEAAKGIPCVISNFKMNGNALPAFVPFIRHNVVGNYFTFDVMESDDTHLVCSINANDKITSYIYP